MADLSQLTAWRDALMAARYQGIRTVEYDGKRVTYASDAEMAAALATLPVAAEGEGADAVWDRLAAGARRAAVLRNQKTLIAAAFAWRGRGRVVGPLNPDLLIRFWVSSWR